MFIGAMADFDQIYTCDYQLHFTLPNALPIINGEKTILMKEPSAQSDAGTVHNGPAIN